MLVSNANYAEYFFAVSLTDLSFKMTSPISNGTGSSEPSPAQEYFGIQRPLFYGVTKWSKFTSEGYGRAVGSSRYNVKSTIATTRIEIKENT